MNEEQKHQIHIVFKLLQYELHKSAQDKGWWPEFEEVDRNNLQDFKPLQEARKKINIGEKIALCHSEVGEASEAYRKAKKVINAVQTSINEIFEKFKSLDTSDNIEDIRLCLDRALEIARCSIWTPDEHCPEQPNFAVELGDTIIRILDLGEALGFDIGAAMLAKIEANKKREYKHGGKKF